MTLPVWSGLIGVIMTGSAAGGWIGGKTADARPDAGSLARIMIFIAASFALAGLFSGHLLYFLAMRARNMAGIYIGALAAAFCLFFLPSLLFGMVNPCAARLSIKTPGSSGGVIGKVYACSSLGALAGTFAGGYFLPVVMPPRDVIFIIAFLMAAAPFFLKPSEWGKTTRTVIFVITCAAAAKTGLVSAKQTGKVIDTRYCTIRLSTGIFGKNGRKILRLQTEPFSIQSAMYIDDPDELVFEYTKYVDLIFHYNPEAKRILLLGGGGYSIPKHLGAIRPDLYVDIVEVDPGMTETARRYFGFVKRPRARIFHEDARVFLNARAGSGANKYDAIFMDVFATSWNIPFQMTTEECMKKVRVLLNDDGVLIINTFTHLESGLFEGIRASIADSFASMEIFIANAKYRPEKNQNIIIAASPGNMPDRIPANYGIASLRSRKWRGEIRSNGVRFTDAFAPVERYSF